MGLYSQHNLHHTDHMRIDKYVCCSGNRELGEYQEQLEKLLGISGHTETNERW